MRQARIKVPPGVGEADYHCWSKTVNGAWLFEEADQEVLRREFWKVADYCGVRVVTHTILSNHFHVIVRVPQERPVSDAELLRRYGVLYSNLTRRQTAKLKVIEAELAKDGPAAVKWRKQQLGQMGDISQYMKLLKQRFSTWFNKVHGRFGPLWSQRFQSVLIGQGALQPMVAYLDLNCVRAGLVTDPKDYRFCGYAEAVAGEVAAQEGLMILLGGRNWAEAQPGYRELLFGVGGKPREGAACIPPEEVRRVMEQGGNLPLADLLRCRSRYLTNGGVLGTKAFVAEQMAAHRRKTGQREGAVPHVLPAGWGDLATLRRPRGRLIG